MTSVARGILLALKGHIMAVRRYGNGFVGLVVGESGEVYRVYVSEKKYSCTCPYYAFTGKPCKHIIALAYYVDEFFGRNLLHHLVSESRVPHSWRAPRKLDTRSFKGSPARGPCTQ